MKNILNAKFAISFFTIYFSICSFSAFAQDSLYFYDITGTKLAPSNQAPIISIVRKEDTGWLKLDYFTHSKKLSSTYHYKDRDFKIKHGEFKSYFANESLANSGYYSNNHRAGFFESYYPNGMMYDSCKYINGLPAGTCNAWYPDGTLERQMQLDSVGNTTGIVIGYFPNGNISYKGRLVKGMRKIGPWTYYHENGNKASILKYPSLDETTLNQVPELKYDTIEGLPYDSLIDYTTAICFDENGMEQQGMEIKNTIGQYKDGINGWMKYLTSWLQGIADTRRSDVNTLTYTCYFSIGTDGKINNVLLSNKVNDQLDGEVRKIFLKSKPWIPPFHNNRKIPFMHRQAIIISPYEANKNLENAVPKKIISTELIGVPSGRGASGNPLNKNQYQ